MILLIMNGFSVLVWYGIVYLVVCWVVVFLGCVLIFFVVVVGSVCLGCCLLGNVGNLLLCYVDLY